MIVKKIKPGARSASKSVAANVGHLTDYLTQGENRKLDGKSVEEVLLTGSQGFVFEGYEAQRAEMIELASCEPRAKHPVSHYVLSWQEGELPSEHQVEQAVGMFLGELGLQEHQVMYALHRDTANVHLHLAINRVHPESERVARVNGGFDIEAAHKAVARIEHAQGWQRERRGRYQVSERGEVVRAAGEPRRQPERMSPAVALEAPLQTAEQLVAKEAAPILQEATSWPQVHRELAERGMRYERKGSGAVIWVGDRAVRASVASREASLRRMQKRLGELQAASPTLKVIERRDVQKVPKREVPDSRREPDQRRRDIENRTGEKSVERQAIEEAAPLLRSAQSWRQVHRQLAERGMRYERKGSGAIVWVGDVAVKASAVDRGASLRKLEGRLGEFQPSGLGPRVAVRPESPPIRPEAPRWRQYAQARRDHARERSEARAALQERIGRERAELKLAHRQRRAKVFGGEWRGQGERLNAMRSALAAEQASQWAQLRDQHAEERKRLQARYGPYPDYEQWLRNQHEPELAEQWRYRNALPGVVRGARHVKPEPKDIRDFTGQVQGAHVAYRRRGAAAGERAAFTDKGQRIDVHAHQERAAVLAALQLGTQKWGQVEVEGNGRYLELVVELSAERGFKVQNPELQERIEQWREALQQERLRQRQALEQQRQQSRGGGRGRGGRGR